MSTDNHAFLNQLDSSLRPLSDPGEIVATAAQLLGESLEADRCAYAEVEADEDHFTITGDYTRGMTPSIVGRFAMSAFGAEVLRLMRADEVYVVNDVAGDERISGADLAAYRQTGIQAVICAPLHKTGRFVAAMAVHQRTPRPWTDEEVELVTSVVNRCWESLERAKSERSLRDSEARYRNLFNSIDQGFCVLEMLFDTQGKPVDYRFLETNPVFEKQTGLVDAVGKTARELVPDLEEHWFTLYGKVALTGEATRFENGSEAMGRWFDVYAFRLVDGENPKVALLFSDITKRKQAEAALVGLNQELEDRVKERTQQVQSLAAELTLAEGRERHRIAQVLHDNLQQQLYAAQFALREVRRRTGEHAEALEDLEKASTLIKDAIVTARRTTANLNPPVLRGEGLLEALHWLSSDMKDRYGLNVYVDAATAPTVSSDSVRMLLFNLVRELLFNVTKHANADEVTVVLVERHDQLEITVSDLGAGFDPTLLESAEYGTGLGLSSVHKRLQLFEGRLEVDSAPGKGTRVTIALPRASLSLGEQ